MGQPESATKGHRYGMHVSPGGQMTEIDQNVAGWVSTNKTPDAVCIRRRWLGSVPGTQRSLWRLATVSEQLRADKVQEEATIMNKVQAQSRQ